MNKQKIKEKGITLVALVVTIIVLLILSGVTITSLLGDNGIISKAQQAANKMNEAVKSEQEELNALLEELNSISSGNGGGTGTGSGTGGDDTPEVPTGPNGKPLLSTITTLQTSGNVEAEDSYGNIVTVPQGFKVVEGSSEEEISVPNGVVIEDSAGNQFVWIPVGTVYKNAEQTQTSTIKLGRYTFDTSDGTPTLQQAAFAGDNPNNLSQTYTDTVTINSYYQELTIARDGVASEGKNGLNATAKNLAAFVQSVSDNGGYYIARYEASYGSGTSKSDYKPLSKPSTVTRKSSNTALAQGMLWNYITQLDAAKVARNMYLNNQDINGNTVGVESDLVNSYAWDTAIVYIQEMGKSNYANANRDTTGNTSLKNTGETGDIVCNIYDMAANTMEWTTEYYTETGSSWAFPCVFRGGHYNGSHTYAAYRVYEDATYSWSANDSFRSTLYVK